MSRLLSLTSLIAGLAACAQPSLDPAAPVEWEPFETWGRGLSGVGPVDSGLDSGGGDDGGGTTTAFDGTWVGTYTFSAALLDYGYTCACSAGVTIGIVNGQMVVGQGDACSMDCGINSQLRFRGAVDAAGAASGDVIEETSFYFTIPMAGTFVDATGTASFATTTTTSQGNTDLSGGWSVTRQ